FLFHAERGGRLRRFVILAATLAAIGGAGWFLASHVSVAGRGGGASETPLNRLSALFEKRDPARDTLLESRILWANPGAMLAPDRDRGIRTAFLGVGPGNWQVEYPVFHRRAMEHPVGTYTLHRYADHPHQDALELLAEYGLVGAGLMAVFLAIVVA